MDFLLVLVKLFLLGVMMTEALQASIGSKSAISLQWRPDHPKFQVEGVAPHQPFFFSETRLNDLSHIIKIWTDLCSVLSKSMCLTDGQTPFLLLVRTGIPCTAEKSTSAIHQTTHIKSTLHEIK